VTSAAVGGGEYSFRLRVLNPKASGWNKIKWLLAALFLASFHGGLEASKNLLRYDPLLDATWMKRDKAISM
jgi:hypothetical protein